MTFPSTPQDGVFFMGLFSRDKPKIKIQTTKKDGFSGWLKCIHCDELTHGKELEKNQNCCPSCNYHYRLSAKKRIKSLADSNSFKELFTHLKSSDPLNFVDKVKYSERLSKACEKTGLDEGVIVGTCKLREMPIALGVIDFAFMGGSMGTVVGERLALLAEHAFEHFLPLIIVSASGGARMQESTLSLMQMAKVSAALAKLHEAGLPYISLLTNPTTGGVTASFASLGDVIIAEPRALIGFTGPRVIEQTIGQKLPPGAQRSEFLLKCGMIDAIVKRQNLREKLAEVIEFFTFPEYNKMSRYDHQSDGMKDFPVKLRDLMTMSLSE